MTERQGVEIDYCPQCRGVWLDRGELDKIIERSAPASLQQPEPPVSHFGNTDHSLSFKHSRDTHNSQSRYDNGHYNKHHKKKSLLSELFDF
jgi:Zn-finger nucleic acid-binding protein